MIHNIINTAVLRLSFISASLLLSSFSYAQTNITIAAIGDSITSGLMRDSSNVITCPVDYVNDICSGNGVKNIGGYTADLASEFQERNYAASVYNWGVGGDRSSATVNRISNIISVSSPQYVTLMTGANDAYDNVSNTTVKFNYQMMVQNILSKGVIPVLGTVTPNRRLLDYEVSVKKYNVVIKEVAQEYNLYVANQFSIINSNFNSYHSGDLLHLNNLGNEKMAEEWFSALNQLLLIPFPEEVKKTNLVPVLKLLLN